ncbi:hypothetical protein CSKR_109641 [Clonorchis sinensis]|uniref:LEM domain-containing protein n=1 Tax=Clonorchis sinensis TaxID=79923 RepID=A0A8T1MAM1_CLOSI|nr:hypothetical protein CSKR_109641 [Clonorchis sinensis]
MDISDEDLRFMLSKYMDVVPPVTETTRQVLLAKLEKHLMSELPPENVGDSSIEKLLETPAAGAVKSPRKSPRKTAPTLQQPNPDTNQTNTTNNSTATEVINGSLSFSSPAQKSSPILEYASRLPSYRRRSIHPERPDLTNPYTDLILPDSVTLLSSRPYSPPGKATPWKRTAGNEKWSVTRKIKDLRSPVSRSVGALINTVRALIVATLRQLSRSVSPRLALFFLIFTVIVLATAHFLLGDPFYHNPVNDLRKQMNV